MHRRNKLKVIKVPLSRDRKRSDRPIAFPKMPQLYLELLENKKNLFRTTHIKPFRIYFKCLISPSTHTKYQKTTNP